MRKKPKITGALKNKPKLVANKNKIHAIAKPMNAGRMVQVVPFNVI